MSAMAGVGLVGSLQATATNSIPARPKAIDLPVLPEQRRVRSVI
jgi:hypothetical protein